AVAARRELRTRGLGERPGPPIVCSTSAPRSNCRSHPPYNFHVILTRVQFEPMRLEVRTKNATHVRPNTRRTRGRGPRKVPQQFAQTPNCHGRLRFSGPLRGCSAHSKALNHARISARRQSRDTCNAVRLYADFYVAPRNPFSEFALTATEASGLFKT